MKKIFILICLILTLITSLSAQKDDLITVRSGSRILDYFPVQERYRYPQFAPGKVFFRNNTFSAFKMNYSYLVGEMQFIQSKDTLVVVNKKDIKYIIIEQDTFFYDKVYIELIAQKGPVMVSLNEYFKLKEVQKKDPYGTASSGSSTQSYGSLPTDGKFYKLTANEDMVFQRVRDYYVSTAASGFEPYNKKGVLKLFPQNEDEIKSYLKSNDIDFKSREDLIKLAGYIQTIMK